MLERHFLLCRGLPALLLDGRRLVRPLHLHVTQEAHDLVLQALQETFKQGKRLALVFLLGVLVGIGSQVDALPELVHHLQVLFPERVQHLQHDLLFELSHARANTLGFLVVSRLHRIDNALPQGLS